MVSLILPTALSGTTTPDADDYVMTAIFFAFVYGIFLFLLGVLKVGTLLENILSRPALTGFTQGASILIACSQLKNVLGYHSHVPYTVDNLIGALFENIGHIHLWTPLIGIPALVIILVMKKVKKTFPTIILVLIVAILISYLAKIEENISVEIVGKVQKGLPAPHFIEGITDRNLLTRSLGSIVVLTFVGYAESISVAKKFAAEHQYTLLVNQELIALGLCNIISAWFQAYPVAGSLPRTVVNAHTGSKTPLATLMACIIVGIMLQFGTDLIYYTPLCILGAIVMSAALSIIDFSEPIFMWKVGKKADCVSFVLTYIATAFFGPILGVATAGLVSLCQVIYHSGRPDVFELGRLPESTTYKNILRFPKAKLVPGVVVIGVAAPRLSFYNYPWFRNGMEQIENDYTHRNNSRLIEEIPVGTSSPPTSHVTTNMMDDTTTVVQLEEQPIVIPTNPNDRLHTIIIDLAPIEAMDGTCLLYFLELKHSYKQKNVAMLFANVKHNVVRSLKKTGLVTTENERTEVFSSIEDAVHYALGHSLAAPTKTETLDDKFPLLKIFTADYNVDEVNLITF
ncbi:hypothetical protein PROFUN_07327 [Planoprotostelium fungivorum]|nr:hypothetical protein PROFUN_07327 [Planoprotostelium fungivorum]